MSSMGNSQDSAQNGSDRYSNDRSASAHQSGPTDNQKAAKSKANPQRKSKRQAGANANQKHSSQKSSCQKYSKQGVSHIDKDFSSIAALNQKLNQPFERRVIGQSSLPSAAQALTKEQQALVDANKKVETKQQMEQALANLFTERQLQGTSIRHPNFNDVAYTPDPARPLDDIPEPTPRYQEALQQLLSAGMPMSSEQPSAKDNRQSSVTATQAEPLSHDDTSMWGLIASPELASHLELLQLGGLINLPARFFEPVPAPSKVKKTQATKAKSDVAKAKEDDIKVDSRALADLANRPDNSANINNTLSHDYEWSLLTPLTQITLLDLTDIQRVCQVYPNLTRYGFAQPKSQQNMSKTKARTKTKMQATVSDLVARMPEMINDVFAPSWELILYPERFDNGVDSLATDILDCSVAVHILKQCQTRQSINRRLTAQQICQHMRSYVLSQCNRYPQYEKQYRQIRLFVGHVVVAAHYLGLHIVYANYHTSHSVTDCQGKISDNLGQPIYFNVSSRSALFHRYPNISNYYINGWS